MKYLKDIIAIILLGVIVVFILFVSARNDNNSETATEETEKYIVSVDINIGYGLKLTKQEDIDAIINILKTHDKYEPRRPFDTLPVGGLGLSFEYSNGETIGVAIVKQCIIVGPNEVYVVGEQLVKKLDDYVMSTEEYRNMAEERSWHIDE